MQTSRRAALNASTGTSTSLSTRAGLSRRSAVRSKSKARSSSPAPAAATWFASCARSVLLCAAPISTRIADSLVPDIKTGADIFDLKSLAGYRFIVTNLPYREQAAILAHLLPIAARDGVRVAVLARSEWSSAKARRALVHENARFAGEVRLTKRPEWVRPAIASPRHWFSWFVWSSEPRATGQDPFLRFAGHVSERRGG